MIRENSDLGNQKTFSAVLEPKSLVLFFPFAFCRRHYQLQFFKNYFFDFSLHKINFKNRVNFTTTL
jgi:hypothetical protein